MKGEIRREKILKRLSLADKPITASTLAEEMGVSRQIIVKDIASLRDAGIPVISHTRGYTIAKKIMPEKVMKVIHSDEDVEKELNLIVDMGGKILDVFVFHKFYNKVSAKMDIKSRMDVKNYLDDIKSGKSSLLKNVTSGYHYHTIAAESEETLKLIEDKLWEAGFLARLKEHEPEEINSQI